MDDDEDDDEEDDAARRWNDRWFPPAEPRDLGLEGLLAPGLRASPLRNAAIVFVSGSRLYWDGDPPARFSASMASTTCFGRPAVAKFTLALLLSVNAAPSTIS